MADKYYAIIGGTSGMGFATAKSLVDRGDRVLVGGRSRERLDGALQRLGPLAQGRTVDAQDKDSIRLFFKGLAPLSGLFIPGASYQLGPFRDADPDLAESPFRGKFWPQYWSAHEALPSLAPNASIVLMSGTASVRPPGNSAAYVACNAAIEGLARGLAIELAPIRVNCLSPGMMDSELWRTRPAEIREPAATQFRQSTALKRVGTVEDAASAVLFMFDNELLTGSCIYLDGGGALR